MDVFISYSSTEYATAKQVQGVLEKNNISTWMAPESIPGGDSYTKAIPRAIKECKVFLLIGSNNAQRSEWVLSEIETALNNRKIVIPFVIEDFSFNEEFDFMLSRRHRIQAFEEKTRALEELVSTIKTHTGIKHERCNVTDTEAEASTVHEEVKSTADATPPTETKTFSFRNGDSYEGEVLNGKYHGQGKYTFASGSVYEGEYRDGKMNGHGKYTYESGDTYEGEFGDGNYNGHGRYTFANGDTYEGEYRDGKKNGHGKYTYASGSVYEGEYRDGKMNGHGKYTYASGDTYEGEFGNGNYNGHGKYIHRNGSVFEGEYRDGKMCGYGKNTFANGDIYEGEFENGKYSGQGKYTFANGSVHEGTYVDGVFTEGVVYTLVNGVKTNEKKYKK